MNEPNQKLEDAVLKRMLETPPTPHKEKGKANELRKPRIGKTEPRSAK
jgi:hypothetical protein